MPADPLKLGQKGLESLIKNSVKSVFDERYEVKVEPPLQAVESRLAAFEKDVQTVDTGM